MPVSDEQFAELVSKMDTLSKTVDKLTQEKPPEETDSTDKTDTRDLSLKKGVDYFRNILKDALPKEKLDTLSFDELVLVAEIKQNDSHFNPPPPIEKKDTDKKDTRPEWLIPKVGGK